MTSQSVARHRFVLACVLCLAVPAVAPAQNSSVAVTEVVEREVNIGHRVVGSVMPITSSTVGSAVDGRVVEFVVHDGDKVTSGQPLAHLRTGTLEIELRAARAELKLREEELKELRQGSRPEEIAEAKARMLASQAIHRNSLSRLQRLEQLHLRQAVSDTDLDDAREQSEAAHQALLALEAAHARIEAGPRDEQIAQAQARVDLQTAQVELIEDRLDKYTIRSPFDGFVTARHTEVGEWITMGDPVADVIALDRVEVVCNIPAEQAVRLRSGSDIRVEFQELPGEVFTGMIRSVVPLADSRTRTFPVRVLLKNKLREGTPVLLAGMLAKAVLPTGARSVMPLVPKDALVLNGSRRVVFVVEQDGAASRVRSIPVSLGIAEAGMIQVQGDLQAGDIVVVRGNERLKDGQDVSIDGSSDRDLSPAD